MSRQENKHKVVGELFCLGCGKFFWWFSAFSSMQIEELTFLSLLKCSKSVAYIKSGYILSYASFWPEQRKLKKCKNTFGVDEGIHVGVSNLLSKLTKVDTAIEKLLWYVRYKILRLSRFLIRYKIIVAIAKKFW